MLDNPFGNAKDSIRGSAASLLGKEKTWQDEVGAMCPSMTYTQRFWGFGICCALGFLLTMGSLLRFVELLAGKPAPFAISYSLGNLLSLAGTSFIIGPCNQIKKMTKKKRWVASLIYLTSIAGTLFLCLYHWPEGTDEEGQTRPIAPSWVPLLIVVAVFTQFLALLWYVFSYIPFARPCLKRCIKNCGTSCAEF